MIPTWRRSSFDDRGVGFAVVGEAERYIVRVSPTAVAVAYMQDWQALQGVQIPADSLPASRGQGQWQRQRQWWGQWQR